MHTPLSPNSSVFRFKGKCLCFVILVWLSTCTLTVWRLLGGGQIQKFQSPKHINHTRHKETNASSRISVSDMGISQEEWDKMQKTLDWPGPDHDITEQLLSTSPIHTTFSIMRLNETYNVGDKIHVTITARDFNNNVKTYGGDFFQVKLFNSPLKASVYGEVIDHHNGTYTVYLLLPWEGQAQVSVRLVHSSEVVWILKKYRETFPRTHYFGYFEGLGPKGTRIRERVKCNIKWPFETSWSKGNCCCEYKDARADTVWQCERPKQLSCENWVYHERGALTNPLNTLEKQMISKKLTNINIRGDKNIINVRPNTSGIGTKKKCKSGLITPVPAGFYLKDVWKSFVCINQVFNPLQMAQCLKNRIVYLLGDSTVRQWFEHLERSVPGLKRMDMHTPSTGGPLMAVQLNNNTIVHWKPHGVPIRFTKMLKTDLHPVSNDIDEIAGGSYAVVVITYWAHLVFHPLKFYIHEVAKIRQAVVRLLSRAPDTTVIIKSGNTAGFKDIFQSDWFALQLDTVMKEMFSDIDGVTYMDVWQMTSCHYLQDNIHPGNVIVANEVNMFLSHICPH